MHVMVIDVSVDPLDGETDIVSIKEYLSMPHAQVGGVGVGDGIG